jgi:hypothetical protein
MSLFSQHVTGAELLKLFIAGNYNCLCEEIEDMLGEYSTQCYTGISASDQLEIDDTVSTILYIFARKEFDIPSAHVAKLIAMGHLMANLIAMSSYGSSDQYLQHITNMPKNLAKILIFYSCRNKTIFNADMFFDLSPKLATLWWLVYSTPSCGSPTELIEKNVNRHLSTFPAKFEPVSTNVTPVFFDCTYAAVQQDRVVKTGLNKHLQKMLPFFKCPKDTDKKSISIVTGRWFPTSAVYKASEPYLRALSEKYDLTLIHLGEPSEYLSNDLFKRVLYTGDVSTGKLDVSLFRSLNSHVAYFPDVGMSNESVALANMKLAPIMVTAYGHPSSTWGSKCDYFIGGQETEIPELAAENYSERLVLIPGIGQVSVFPNYKRKYPKFTRPIINCAWTAPKINYTMLKCLREIIDRVPGTMVRIFPAWTIGRNNSMMACISDLSEMFGDDELAVCPEMPYQDYLTEMEKGTITLDSWPFGGYNTIVDSLFVGVPVVTLEGKRFYNRASSALMRRCGFTELVASNHTHYVEKAIEVLSDSLLGGHYYNILKDTKTLRKLLCDNGEAAYFVKAFDYLIANHDRLQAETTREPIVIC